MPDSSAIFIGDAVQLTALDAPGTVVWSSTDANIADVVSETGYVHADSAGTVQISAVSGSAVATANVTVLRPPSLGVSEPTVEFDMLVNGNDPPAQTLTIENVGDGPLNGIGLGEVSYGSGQASGWLGASVNGSAAPAKLTLDAHGAGLPRGTYTAIVRVTGNVDNSPQVVAVTLKVQAPPSIAPSRTTVPMVGILGATDVETVDIANGGDRPLTGLTTQIGYANGQPTGWLAASLSDTTAPATLTLTATLGSLPIGTYDASVTVSSTDPSVASVDIAVRLTVTPGPAISLSETNVTTVATTGTDPAPTTVSISNGGGGTLSGLTLGSIQYVSGGASGWLAASLGSSNAPSTLALTISSASLAEGSYSAAIPVQSPVASNSPVTLTVNLTVEPPPVIAVNPDSLTFVAWKGGSARQQAVQVTNGAGAGTLSGLSYTVAYSGASGWLSGTWQNGNTTAPATLLVQPTTSSLAVGTYKATVTVHTNISGVAPKSVTVSYEVRAFSTEIYPTLSNTSTGCSRSGCHTGGQPPTLNGTSSQDCAALQSFLTAGQPSTSTVYEYIHDASAGHSGGLFPVLASSVYSWIKEGAPCG